MTPQEMAAYVLVAERIGCSAYAIAESLRAGELSDEDFRAALGQMQAELAAATAHWYGLGLAPSATTDANGTAG